MPQDSGLQFVMDGPVPPSGGKKKRARLVTSCDPCRLRKVRCIQNGINTDCDTCIASQTRCVYGDREKYHAIRGASSAHMNYMPSPWKAVVADDVRASDSTSNNSASSSPIAPQSPAETYWMTFSSHPSQPGGSNHRGLALPPGQSFVQDESSTNLNQPIVSSQRGQRHAYPTLMVHLVEQFVEQFGAQFPFLSHDAPIQQVREGSLPPPMAYSLASLSARFSGRPEFGDSQHSFSAGSPYLQTAKSLVSSSMGEASLRNLQSMVILAWAEYGREFQGFTAKAMQISNDLQKSIAEGNGDGSSAAGRLLLTKFCLRKLAVENFFASGRPPQREIFAGLNSEYWDNTHPIYFSLLSIWDLFEQALYIASASQNPGATRAQQLSERFSAFVSGLHPKLEINEKNLRQHHNSGTDALLVSLHLTIYTTKLMLSWPSVWRLEPEHIRTSMMTGSPPSTLTVQAAYSAALMASGVLRLANRIAPMSLMSDPFFIHHINLMSKIFTIAAGVFGNKEDRHYSHTQNGGLIALCSDVLSRISRYWSPTDSHRQPREQSSVSPSNALYGNQSPSFPTNFQSGRYQSL